MTQQLPGATTLEPGDRVRIPTLSLVGALESQDDGP